MKKNILWLLALLFPFVMGSCSEDDIVFDHEQPMFDIQEGKILLEVILPSTTTSDEEVYIAGDFNGGEEVAVGNDTWKLIRTEKSSIKRGIYLDPATFVNGKTLADGFHFVSDAQRNEVTALNEPVEHSLNLATGTRTNVYVDQWAAFFDQPDEETPIEHDGFAVFVDDQTGWDNLYLYMWGDVNDLNGAWPGMTPTGTQTINGVTYKYFDMGSANTGLAENLIFNNGDGTQLADFAFTIDRDIYLRITAEGVEEISPAVKHDGFAVFVDDQTGWDDLYLYMWGDVNDLNGAWPGMVVTGTQTINGVEYKYFDLGAANTGLAENLIFNNGNGSQLADFAFTIDRDIYLQITTSGVTEIGEGDNTGGEDPITRVHKLYINDLTGWSDTGLYAWGDNLPELFGGWPGVTSFDTETIGGTTFKVVTFDESTNTYNLIFNGSGGQIDGPAITLDRDYYLEVTAEAFTETERPAGAKIWR